MVNKPIRFGIIGSGWRAEMYLRLANLLPQQFQVSGVLIRNPEKYQQLIAKYNLTVYSSVERLAAESDFVVLAVSKTAAAPLLLELAALNIPVLAETPTASTPAEYELLRPLAVSSPLIQVAEQYPLLPHHQARTAYIKAGGLGQIGHVQVSVAHGYHGISLIRRWLSVTGTACEITARRVELPIMDFSYRGRAAEDSVKTEQQDIAVMVFPTGQSAVLDFTRSQYFSPLRSNRVLIRGSHGEIRDNEIIRRLGVEETEYLNIMRVQGGQEGSLDSLGLRELRAGQHNLFPNPFTAAPLSDEEIGIGQALLNMADYLQTGESSYSLADALTDVRLAFAVDEAIESGSTVTVAEELVAEE
ncbi:MULTISPECIES: Gfo/Idh/MocA family oxidoreductase [unclassified Paenibacillus]|uniref:Gfo/Idh/MocA family protein n=1 Tax=unclassified Paenibacillus TaxID=185978 RepID=UPI002406E805|nr:MULTISPECIES: Gfo/Idh/MocA family oxidoreductase [unclassified Paenibacillus]MDF9845294.1 putative dehydrogenase [Paenibacillus sp. PastF-2]MDF9851876.1 putative dehydrogenase [Paenibacillus sp. PastM-2]MDF9857753.1 putative dehydrogenase [Paenibacillus sp. PastF-1]MDH6483020.1 putative dehydrogenase [Paenibacillus sp. PastH-2]